MLYTAHELTDVVGPGLTRALEDMRDAAIAAEDNTEDRGLWNSTIALCRELESDPQAGARLRGLHVKRNEPIVALLETLEQFLASLQKQLSTTVEDEMSYDRYYREVCNREEKANTERSSLEQQLKLERRERVKQLSGLQEMVTRSRADYTRIKMETKSNDHRLKSEADKVRAEDAEAFAAKHEQLGADLDSLRKQLVEVQAENREEELLLRKKTMKAEGEVRNWLAEYDKDMSFKQKTLKEEELQYNEVRKQLEQYERHYMALRAEAEAAAAAELERRKARAAEERRLRRIEKCARTIQATWRSYRLTQAAEEAPTKKGKGKKKK